jgi:hypothetical protein
VAAENFGVPCEAVREVLAFYDTHRPAEKSLGCP